MYSLDAFCNSTHDATASYVPITKKANLGMKSAPYVATCMCVVTSIGTNPPLVVDYNSVEESIEVDALVECILHSCFLPSYRHRLGIELDIHSSRVLLSPNAPASLFRDLTSLTQSLLILCNIL